MSEVSDSNSWKDDSDRFVLYLDIMGFKERVNRTPIGELKKELLDFKNRNIKIEPLREGKSSETGKQEFLKIAQFSDSIVVISKGASLKDLNRITKAGAILMQNSLESGFALRGAIASGNMIFDDENQIFFGKALVDAYLLEESLAYYGIVFHESAESSAKRAVNSKEAYYPIVDQKITLKAGRSRHFHIAWYDIDKKLSKGDIRKEAIVWLEKLRKTVSGNPRVYLDNTIDIILDECKTVEE